jgi:hypothetical protein
VQAAESADFYPTSTLALATTCANAEVTQRALPRLEVDSWPGGGRVRWQVRAKNVMASAYPSKADAVRQIAHALGRPTADVRNAKYTVRGPDAGVLLAWSYRPLRRLDLPRPPDMPCGRTVGYESMARPILRRWGLSDRQTPAGRPKGAGALPDPPGPAGWRRAACRRLAHHGARS